MSNSLCQPIFCVKNAEPASLNESFPKYKGKDTAGKYDWVVFLVSGISHSGENEYRCSYTICDSRDNSLIKSDVAGFRTDDKESLRAFACAPINLFKKTNLNVFLFDKKKRTGDEVHSMVRAWSKNKTTNN